MARAITLADKKGFAPEYWVQGVLGFFFCNEVGVDFEPLECEHDDLEFLYVVEGVLDYRRDRTKRVELPVTISLYSIGWCEPYADAMNQEPIFSGTAYEYIEKFGKEQQ